MYAADGTPWACAIPSRLEQLSVTTSSTTTMEGTVPIEETTDPECHHPSFECLALVRCMVSKMWGQSSNNELLQHTLEGNFPQPDHRVLHNQSGAIAITSGMVEV